MPEDLTSGRPGTRTCFDIDGLTKTYGDGPAAVQALRGITTRINMGEMVVLLGPSGSGKSTFLNILGGLDCATSGHVLFDGRNITAMSTSDLTQFRRDHVGFIFQNYNLMPGLTAIENVRLITEIAASPMPAVEALDMVGLAERGGHFPAQLSGGEQQRVAIARAIAKQPEILLCDEPTGALDSKTSKKVLVAIENVVKRLGTTVIMVTHHQGIAPIADRVIRFKDGLIDQEQLNTERVPASEIEL